MARKTSPEAANSTSVTVRFPEKIYEWLKQASEQERRSFNAQVLLQLERLMQRVPDATPDA